MDLHAWAMPRLQALLPLDEESLTQVVDYAASLPRNAVGDHFKDLLGESPKSLEFITSFVQRLPSPSSSSSSATVASDTHVPPVPRQPRRKGKAPLHKFANAPRKPNEGTVYESVDLGRGYVKKDEDEVYAGPASKSGSGASTPRRQPQPTPNAFTLDPDSSSANSSLQLPSISARDSASSASSRNASPGPAHSPKFPPGAQGSLTSDPPKPRKKKASTTSQPQTFRVPGGTSMHGPSATINDLDSAIRALEIQTNPSLGSSNNPDDLAKRKCDCMATRHPLLEAAPNCLNCGKIICVKEGLGPCTFCGKPLLSSGEIQSMVHILREERGREKMEANNAAHRRADVSQKPRAFAGSPAASTPATSESEGEGKLAAAKQHRDRLLGFQAASARRTQIIDESADYETPASGQSMWATPEERARQLKRQQKVLREQEWNQKPEWEKRRVVVSVDLVGNKVVKRMAKVDRPESPESGDDADEPVTPPPTSGTGHSSGAFSRNPLLGAGLIRPVYKDSTRGTGKSSTAPQAPSGESAGEASSSSAATAPKKSTWSRVQDDMDDNEAWILDGGVYGGERTGTQGEEPACG